MSMLIPVCCSKINVNQIFHCWLKRSSVMFLFAYSFKFLASLGKVTTIIISNNNQAMLIDIRSFKLHMGKLNIWTAILLGHANISILLDMIEVALFYQTYSQLPPIFSWSQKYRNFWIIFEVHISLSGLKSYSFCTSREVSFPETMYQYVGWPSLCYVVNWFTCYLPILFFDCILCSSMTCCFSNLFKAWIFFFFLKSSITQKTVYNMQGYLLDHLLLC